MAIKIPGNRPPTKQRPTEAPTVTHKITMGRDGGIIGPSTEEAAVMAQEKSSSYPISRIASISILPRPPASATAVPLMPANSAEQIMFACPIPPGTVPTMTLAKRNSFRVTPPVFIRFPIRMKNGAAIIVNELAACVVLCTTAIIG